MTAPNPSSNQIKNINLYEERLFFLAKIIDTSLVLFGIALIATGLARVANIYDEPLSIPQTIQSLLGLIFLIAGVLKKGILFIRESEVANKFHLLLKLLPFISFSLFIVYRFQLEDLTTYRRLVEEGSLVEWLSFLFLLLSSIVLFLIGKHNINKLVNKYALVLGGSMFVLSMEEISWGQMIFNWQSPKFFNNFNAQQETNIHNFIFLSGQPNTLIITLVLFILTVFCVINYFINYKIKPNSILDISFPSFSLVGYFVIGAFVYLCLFLQQKGIYIPILVPSDQELIECFFSLGILLHTFNIYLKWGKFLYK